MMKKLLFLPILFLVPALCFGAASREWGTVAGITERINFGTHSTSAARSYVIWINPDSEGTSGEGMIYTSNNGTNIFAKLRFKPAAVNAVEFNATHTTSMLDAETADSSITLNSWQSLILTWDGSTTAANVKFYVNLVET